ncbi:PHP domain-containing protein [Halothermothrix orenii]|uniref:PHP domain protein n=1 Tax=Halothermothrix orenii (strain H 168 / OCM 544 / DSM 9562) TaxID=373903 RepID=B8CXB4_HALOH|nr:PHP domain-containing protein [Halothermothrix orenii]ACL69933.1 PHP domain protein [Halothermothrix orenii H 168]
MSVDLHIHTNASDGSLSPGEVVKKAIDLGYKAIAITDHDTVAGIIPALQVARKSSLEVIPGIEINTDIEDRELHILGYFIDYTKPDLLKELSSLKKMREKRARKMVQKLRNMGINIEWEEVINIAGQGTIGRSHICQAIINKGYADSWKEVFEKYIGKNSPAYVPRKKLTPLKAIKLIKECSGIPVIAHPGLVGDDDLVKWIIKHGIEGLEVFYYEHSEEECQKYLNMAKENNLVVTGGSDDHGPGNKDGLRLGKIRLDYTVVEELRKRV